MPPSHARHRLAPRKLRMHRYSYAFSNWISGKWIGCRCVAWRFVTFSAYAFHLANTKYFYTSYHRRCDCTRTEAAAKVKICVYGADVVNEEWEIGGGGLQRLSICNCSETSNVWLNLKSSPNPPPRLLRYLVRMRSNRLWYLHNYVVSDNQIRR